MNGFGTAGTTDLLRLSGRRGLVSVQQELSFETFRNKRAGFGTTVTTFETFRKKTKDWGFGITRTTFENFRKKRTWGFGITGTTLLRLFGRRGLGIR
jgi:hypothetical protein